MRAKTDLFLIDGQPILAPDENLQITEKDLEAADSARDESGFLHRFVVRQGVGKWQFVYADLTGEEYAYMESLFAGKDSFQLSYLDCAAAEQKLVTAYREEHTVLWKSAAASRFCNYKFSISAC